MRFELSIALKYLIPRAKHLSVSIISLVSILVVSLVVWLVLVFLSVTEGLEKKWIDELVSINAPLRVIPTEDYYRSYYYQIDEIAMDSGYATKSLGEKLLALETDPYDSRFDRELPEGFPLPDQDEQGEVKDLVKELEASFFSLQSLHQDLSFHEFEVSFGTLYFQLLDPTLQREHSFISQLSYVASQNLRKKGEKLLLLPTTADLSHFFLNFLSSKIDSSFLEDFFSVVKIVKFSGAPGGVPLSISSLPKQSSFEALALSDHEKIGKIFLPSSSLGTSHWERIFLEKGYSVKRGILTSNQEQLFFIRDQEKELVFAPIFLTEDTLFTNLLDKATLTQQEPNDLKFLLETEIQGIPIQLESEPEHLLFSEIEYLDSSSSLWAYFDQEKQELVIPSGNFGNGVLIAKQFQKNGIRMGDRGTISYPASSLTTNQEQKLPIYVAGFYDPGLFPMGSKLVFANPLLTSQLRNNYVANDQMLGNGMNVWINEPALSEEIKKELIVELNKRGIERFFHIESFQDLEFARPILQQLKSDKNLFTILAIIILIVACSNIISMLILLVNDKKREIAILQAMGVSSLRVATIFGLCGFLIGFISSCIGIALAIFTLKNLHALINFLSFLQGHDAFQSAFYGSILPNELSYSALGFVLLVTILLSFIAALIPAVKASKIQPSQLLRGEG